jgi:hypothetical protein
MPGNEFFRARISENILSTSLDETLSFQLKSTKCTYIIITSLFIKQTITTQTIKKNNNKTITIHQKQSKNKNLMKNFAPYYDTIAIHYNGMVPQNNKIAEFIMNKMMKYVKKKNAKILELSAGTGILSEKIIKKWSDLTITDISKKL